MKSQCENTALLDAFVDGELSADDAERLKAHLDGCPVCRAYLDDLLAIREAFPTLEDTVVPEGFAERVITSLLPQKPRLLRFPGTEGRRMDWRRAVLPVAACFCVVVALRGVTMWNDASGGGDLMTRTLPETEISPQTEAVSTEDAAETEAVSQTEAVPRTEAVSVEDAVETEDAVDAARIEEETAEETETAQTAETSELYEYAAGTDGAGVDGGADTDSAPAEESAETRENGAAETATENRANTTADTPKESKAETVRENTAPASRAENRNSGTSSGKNGASGGNGGTASGKNPSVETSPAKRPEAGTGSSTASAPSGGTSTNSTTSESAETDNTALSNSTETVPDAAGSTDGTVDGAVQPSVQTPAPENNSNRVEEPLDPREGWYPRNWQEDEPPVTPPVGPEDEQAELQEILDLDGDMDGLDLLPVITVPPEAAALLNGFPLVELSAEGRWYVLTAAELADLNVRLEAEGFSGVSAPAGADRVRVLVLA